MSINAYGDLERGDSDIKLSKLEKIAELFGVELNELCCSSEKGFVNLSTGRSKRNNKNYCSISSSIIESSELAHKLEKSEQLNEQQNKEIELLKEVIALMKKKVA